MLKRKAPTLDDSTEHSPCKKSATDLSLIAPREGILLLSQILHSVPAGTLLAS